MNLPATATARFPAMVVLFPNGIKSEYRLETKNCLTMKHMKKMKNKLHHRDTEATEKIFINHGSHFVIYPHSSTSCPNSSVR